MMSHCGADLNREWVEYMDNRKLASSIEFKLKVTEMANQTLSALERLH